MIVRKGVFRNSNDALCWDDLFRSYTLTRDSFPSALMDAHRIRLHRGKLDPQKRAKTTMAANADSFFFCQSFSWTGPVFAWAINGLRIHFLGSMKLILCLNWLNGTYTRV